MKLPDVKFDKDEGIVTKEGLDFPKTKIDFEQYLQEKFWEAEPQTLDDQFPDAFNDWLVEEDPQTIIDFGQEYAELIFHQK